MEYTRVGKSDLRVSRIGLGGLQFGTKGLGVSDKEVMKDIINRAIDLGVNFIDTAEIYAFGGSERVIGEAIKERGDRDDLVIATKVHPENLRYKDVLKAADASLARLQTDVIDLYRIHHPNPSVPIKETIKGMDELLKAGKIRYVGVSNFDPALTRLAMDTIRNGEIVSNQMEYSLVMRDIEEETLPFLREVGMSTIAYSPLSLGVLTGKYDESTELPKEDRRRPLPLFRKDNIRRLGTILQEMREIAEANDVHVSQVALNWLLRFDDIIPIPGAKSPAQVESNVSATEWEMSRDEWERLTRASDEADLDYFFDITSFG